MLTLTLPATARDRVIYSASLHSRTTNKVGVVRPSGGPWCNVREAFQRAKN